MAAHKGQIPGLYTSEKSVDWSSDSIGQDNQSNINNSSINMDSSQCDNKNAVSEMRSEKDNLGLNFVHAHRLLEEGEIGFFLVHTKCGHIVSFLNAMTFSGCRNIKSPGWVCRLYFL